MALTNTQLVGLGFKPSVRGRGGLGKTKKYDSLVLPINETDFLYTGFNPYKDQINYKTIWKSFKDINGNRITYQVINLADTGYKQLKDYITRTQSVELNKNSESINVREPEFTTDAPDMNVNYTSGIDPYDG